MKGRHLRRNKMGSISSRYIPAWDISIQNITAIRNATILALEDIASRELYLPKEKLINRPLLAEDLGLEFWITPPLKAGETIEWIKTTVAEYRFIAFTKVIIISDEPVISTLRFKMGSIIKGIFDLDELHVVLPAIRELSNMECSKAMLYQFGGLHNLRMEAYFPNAFVAHQFTPINVTIKAIKDSPGEHFILGGIVVEEMRRKIL